MPTGVYLRPSELTRFESYVIPEPNTGCWLWIGSVTGQGYGYFHRANYGRSLRAHRYAYEQFVGPIPSGYTVDHLCRQRTCVNPQHLEAVSMEENRRRGLCGVLKTHCKYGHEYTPENTYVNLHNRVKDRRCKQCRKDRCKSN